MLKGLVNLFKCCKPQNRSSKNPLEKINYQDTDMNTNEDVKKNLKKCPTDKTLTTKCTNYMNNCQTINSEKEKSPETEITKKKINNPYIDFPFEAKNVNDEKNYVFNAEKEINFDFPENNAIEANKGKDLVENQELNNFCLVSQNKNENNNQQNDGNYSSIENMMEINKINCSYSKNDEGEILTEALINEDEFDKIIVPDKYIREDEKDHLVWSKNGIIDFINKLMNLEEYTEIKTKEIGLDIQIKKSGSDLTKSIYVVKGIYKVAKKEFIEGITLDFLRKLMYEPELRLKWDEGFKEFVKLEGDDEVYAVKSWFKSPMFIISERDVVDKRIEFFKDNVYYNFSSSLDDKFIPEQKGVIRCKDYFNVFVAEQDGEFYYFTTVNQCDIKVIIILKVLDEFTASNTKYNCSIAISFLVQVIYSGGK